MFLVDKTVEDVIISKCLGRLGKDNRQQMKHKSTIENILSIVEKTYLENRFRNIELRSFSEKIYWMINDFVDWPTCVNCNNSFMPHNFYGINGGYYEHFCSKKCRHEKAQTSRTSTNLDRFGVENTFQSEEKKQKIVETCQKRYEVDNPSSSSIIKERRKQTNLDRFGVENTFQSEEKKQKIVETCIETFGVKHPLQNTTIFERVNKKRTYKMILPSGKIQNYQGYENVAISKLLSIYEENDIVLDKCSMPTIWYNFNGENKRYFPDIFIPKDKLIIEVKSTWTFKKDFEKNLAKRIGVINAYLKFQFWICNNTEIIQIIKETNYE